MPQNAVEAAAVLHPIATRRYVSLLKIAHWCYLPVQGDYSPDNVKFPDNSWCLAELRWRDWLAEISADLQEALVP